MKKIFLCLMILVVSMSSFGQQIDTSKIEMSKINTRKYYLSKSTKQLIGGTILRGIGVQHYSRQDSIFIRIPQYR